MKILRNLLPIIFILVLSVFTVVPFFHSGFFPIHDNTQVARVYEMGKALRDGMFPVRWTNDLGYGYGYPIFNFYDPLPYYIGGAISLLGLNALLATKIMMVLGILFAGISMYFLAGQFWGDLGGIFSALFYMYAPYHALDAYVRGDVAEFWAFAFIPLIFYGLWKIYKQEKWRYVIISSIAFACVVISHNLTAMMVSPFLVAFAIYLVFKSRKKKVSLYIIASFVIGLLLSAFYWLPAILELKYTNVSAILTGGSNFRDNFVCLTQLWTSPWGYGGSTKGCIDGLSFMVGKYHIILSALTLIFAVFVLASRKYKAIFEKEKSTLIILSFLGFLVSGVFTLQISQPIWELIKPMEFLQYPWRFLLMMVFFSSFSAGFLFWVLEKFVKNKLISKIILIILSIGFIFVSLKFFAPESYSRVDSNHYTNSYALEWVTSKVSDEYMPLSFQTPKTLAGIASFSKLNSKTIQISSLSQKTQTVNVTINSTKDQSIVIPIAYFPAWSVSIDGQPVSIKKNTKGILIDIPQGQHQYEIIFKQTPIELFANALSIIGLLSLFLGIIHLNKKYA